MAGKQIDRKLRLRWIEAEAPWCESQVNEGSARADRAQLAQQLGVRRLRFALKGVICEIDVPLGPATSGAAVAS